MVDLSELEKKIEIKFKNGKLLDNAFVHRSYLNENKKYKGPSNETLEFLGDSVLSLITSLYLFKKYPKLLEGDYTDIKAHIVRTESLAEAGRKLDLGQYLKLSRGEHENKGRDNTSIMADTYEALIGAIFLDSGFDESFIFVEKFLLKDKIEKAVTNKLYYSSKNRLQEYLQNKYKKLPQYKIIAQTGPEHNKNFRVGVYLKGELMGEGAGGSKKRAEEEAAKKALLKIGV